MRIFVEKRKITACAQCGHLLGSKFIIPLVGQGSNRVTEGYCKLLKRDITRTWQIPKDCPLEKVLESKRDGIK